MPFFLPVFWIHSSGLFSDIMLYTSSITIVFWKFCMLAEKCQNMVIWMEFYFEIQFFENIVYFCQGKAVARALHIPSNYHDENYQRFIRIFSLQMKDQPIKITMKHMFTFNYSLLKSVSWNSHRIFSIKSNKNYASSNCGAISFNQHFRHLF